MQAEGVIKFDLQFSTADAVDMEQLQALNRWRTILWTHGLIGQDPGRYAGHAFGNVSQRIAPFDAACGRRAFIISGSQTGGLQTLDKRHYTIVSAWDLRRNRVVAKGPLKPSSESLTHAVLYDLDDSLRVVLHVHSAAIWATAAARGIPVTDPSVEYGTPAMAAEVRRLFGETTVRQTGLFAMGGHEDGVVAFATDADLAGRILLQALEASRSRVK